MEMTRVALYLPLGRKRTPWSGIGGAEKRLSFLISHMDDQKYDKRIVFRVFDNEEKVVEALEPYIGTSCQMVFVHSDYEAFKHFVKHKYDYVLYDDCIVKTIPGAVGAKIANSTRILIFVTIYYTNWTFGRNWRSLIMRLNGFLSSKIDCLYPSAKSVLEGVFSEKRVTVTPCSLPMLEQFIEASEKHLKERKIVFASRLIADKNPLLLLEAVKLIQKELRDCKYQVLICGAGPLEEEIESYIETNELTEIVQFLGPQKMTDVLPTASVFCSLQGTENYPSQSLLEAISSGCYCLATNVGDTSLLIRNSFGELIEKNPVALSEALLRAINMTGEEMASAKQSALEFAAEYFNPENAIIHYETLCSD